jgi:hypothetical protein
LHQDLDLHDRVSEEVDPDPVPPDTVLCNDGVLVGNPVEVPPVNGGGIVDTEDIDRLDLKVGRLELEQSAYIQIPLHGTHLADDPSEGKGGVGSREDVLVHATHQLRRRMLHHACHSQETPVEILVLPTSPDTGNLEDHDTIIGKEIVDVLEESRVSPDTDVLGHFETRDLVVVARSVGDISEIVTENSTLRLGNVVLLQSLGTESSLFTSESDTSDISLVVFGSVGNKSSPSTTDIQQPVTFLELEFVANHGHLVVL